MDEIKHSHTKNITSTASSGIKYLQDTRAVYSVRAVWWQQQWW